MSAGPSIISTASNLPTGWILPARRLAAAGLLALGGCDRWEAPPLAAGGLVGDSTCVSCHEEMSAFAGTAHSRTSSPPLPPNIHGSFEPGENVLRTSNPYLHYRMEARETGFHQTAVVLSGGDSTERSERFDIVVGSGRKGQSYLYWQGDRLFQLPVSYWVGMGWVNSPAFPDGTAIFDRTASPRCLECHTTYVPAAPGTADSNRYDPEEAALGISCESCHGAGGEHAERVGSRMSRLRGPAIVSPADLSRERRVEGCALCHGGVGESLRPPFSYTPGAPLGEFLRLPMPVPGEPVDVHGNQVALLMRSPCFQGSEMTCSTCHDVHRLQADLAEFSTTCNSCHEPGREIPADHGASMPGNCVDCHMPALPTSAIFTNASGGRVRPSVRTHWIGVYPPEAVAGERQATPLTR